MLRIALTAAAAGTAALLAFAAPAAPRQSLEERDEARLAKRMTRLVPDGPAQACITPGRTSGGERYGNVSLIEGQGARTYLTRFDATCQLRDSDTLISIRPTNRLCSGDIVQVRELGVGVTRSCVYSDFTPYRRAK